MRHAEILTFALLAIGACTRPASEQALPPVAEPAPVPAPAPEAAAPTSATAALAGPAGSTISGTVRFHAMDGGVHVEATVEGAPPGTHGFHVHEVGDCSAPDFSSAGGHFNPHGTEHGGPDSPAHHAGDLGNIEIGEDGSGTLSLHADELSLAPGADSVIGRAVVLHENADDLATQPTGNAGGRIACGVVAADGGAV